MDLRRLAIVEACIIAALTVVGGIRGYFEWDIRVIDLNAEGTLPALFSAALLLFAAYGALRLRRFRDNSGAALLGVAAVFAFMAVDEVTGLHEELHDTTGVTWQLLYLPLGVAVAWAFYRALDQMRPPEFAPRLFLAGVGAWIASQLFDLAQNRGFGELQYPVLIVPEEALEMAGSALFGLALWAAVQHLAAGRTAKSRVGPAEPIAAARF